MAGTRIVVGADGSPGAVAAVRWAAAEARLREAELRVLVAHQRGAPTAGVLHAAVAEARAAAPGIEVRGVAMPGYAAPVLVHAAEEAALVVLGGHGRAVLPGFSFASVSSQVAARARVPVLVVRGRAGGDGPVVAGVDDGPAAGTVVGQAFEEAALRGAPLLAVTARPAGRSAASPAGSATRPAAATALGADIDQLLDPWRAKYPGVAAERRVATGRPEKALVLSSREARLVVVGPRRHGLPGVLLGPVGTRLLQRADCPVLIAR